MVGAFQPGKMHRPASTPFRPRYNSAVTVVHVLAFLTATTVEGVGTATTATPPHAPATPSPFATPSSNPSLPPQPLHQHPGFESRHDHDHLHHHHHHHEEEAEAEAEGRGGEEEEEEEEDGFMSVGRVHCMTEAEEDDSSAAHVAATTLLREAALLRQRNGGRHRRLGLTGGEEKGGGEGEGEAATGSSVEIKVAVHILHNDEVAKVQRRYIDDQMAVLNKAYNTAAEECNSEPGEARIGFALSKLSYHNNQKWSE